MIDIAELAEKHLDAARSDPHGRSAGVVAHDGELRQSVIALTAGSSLGSTTRPTRRRSRSGGGGCASSRRPATWRRPPGTSGC